MIVIEMAHNGWLIRDKSDSEMEKLFVFSEGDTDKEAVEGFRYLLWTLNDLCGPTTSRYSAHRINITIEPGDKHEGGDDESVQPCNNSDVESD
jgi:hypothetical protein